jgi:predicted aminopeptidase
MRIWLKRTLYALILTLFVLILINLRLIQYGIGQAQGQFSILWNAKSIEETLADPEFPDSLKQNLLLVEEIKRFAIDSLGLATTKNYSTVYDQKGKDILWVVSACEPYEFRPMMWSFPIIGSFSYKGFFDLEKAKQLARELKDDSLDIHVRSVSGWSTLGWFKDPILSNMLTDSPGELANTIIHELTHGTLFIPDSMTFNENLATFIGNQGAKDFLAYKYGKQSNEFSGYVSTRNDSKIFTSYIVGQVRELDSLYNSMLTAPDSVRRLRKEDFIDELILGLRNIDFHNQEWYENIYSNYRPNNAYFISFLNYRERQDEFDSLYLYEYQNNLADFINSWKQLYSN